MEDRTADRIAGTAMIGAAAAILLAMGHHPTRDGGGGVNQLVHSTLILLVGVLAFGFGRWAIGRGIGRPAVLAGVVPFAVGTLGHIVAATLNGFVAPALTGAAAAAVFAANQAFAKLGVIATGIAYLFWSLAYLAAPGTRARLIGAVGLVAGAAPAVALAAGAIRLDLAGATIVYGAMAGWAALVGLDLLLGQRRA